VVGDLCRIAPARGPAGLSPEDRPRHIPTTVCETSDPYRTDGARSTGDTTMSAITQLKDIVGDQATGNE
jgi:hypothetical protein